MPIKILDTLLNIFSEEKITKSLQALIIAKKPYKQQANDIAKELSQQNFSIKRLISSFSHKLTIDLCNGLPITLSKNKAMDYYDAPNCVGPHYAEITPLLDLTVNFPNKGINKQFLRITNPSHEKAKLIQRAYSKLNKNNL